MNKTTKIEKLKNTNGGGIEEKHKNKKGKNRKIQSQRNLRGNKEKRRNNTVK